MELIALIAAAVLGALIWQIISYNKRQNEEFIARKMHYENQEANRLEEQRERAEAERIEQMTDEELDAEFEKLEDDSADDEAEARFQQTVREIQEISDNAWKR